jgi:assimilatory nitrate reductase catalytic subunit
LSTKSAFIARRTLGWDEVAQAVRAYPPARVAAICGIDEQTIADVALTWGRAGKAMAWHARGLEHHVQGVDNVLTVINLVLASGQIGAATTTASATPVLAVF